MEDWNKLNIWSYGHGPVQTSIQLGNSKKKIIIFFSNLCWQKQARALPLGWPSKYVKQMCIYFGV
jgi:hypothetical protein